MSQRACRQLKALHVKVANGSRLSVWNKVHSHKLSSLGDFQLHCNETPSIDVMLLSHLSQH